MIKQKMKITILMAAISAIIILFVVAFFLSIKIIEREENGTSFNELYGDTIQERVWFALKDFGLSDEKAAGAMGNIDVESGGFSLSAVESNGVGIGLIQWSFGRRTQLESYATSKGVSWKDEATQIEFLIAEMTPGGNGIASYQFMNNNGWTVSQWEDATSVETATKAFCWTFERPNEQLAHVDRRVESAKNYYNQFHGAIRGTNSMPGTKGYYRSSSGKRYKLYVQDIPSTAWYSVDGCFHSSLATAMSGFGSTYTPNQLDGFSYGSGCYGYQGNVSWIGCSWNYINQNQVKDALKAGNPIMINVMGNSLTTDNGTEFHRGHWLVMMDYKNENGVDKVYIHDPWSTHTDYGWGNLNSINGSVSRWLQIYKN